MDNDTLFGGASQRVYAFTSYPETVARFESGRESSALDQIRRTYGWMDSHDPGVTDWEGIGPDGSLYEGGFTSMAHGWSTDVLPALTHQLLGARPTSPGYATWEVRPHPGDVTWAQGELSTPTGSLVVDWTNSATSFTLTLQVPHGTRGAASLPVSASRGVVRQEGRVVWDGHRARGRQVAKDGDRVTISGLGPGRHRFTVTH